MVTAHVINVRVGALRGLKADISPRLLSASCGSSQSTAYLLNSFRLAFRAALRGKIGEIRRLSVSFWVVGHRPRRGASPRRNYPAIRLLRLLGSACNTVSFEWQFRLVE